MAKEDLRIRKTKQNIREAFLELCRKKPVSKITVTELADRAMINKGTFYLHYSDIYDLYLEVVKETCMEIFDRIENFSLFFRDPEQFVRTWYDSAFGTDFSEVFPHFSPNELGLRLPALFITEFKNRIYATGIIRETSENEIKIDCILCSLLVASLRHYKQNPELTIKTLADQIRQNFS